MLEKITEDAVRFYRNQFINLLYSISDDFIEKDKPIVVLKGNHDYTAVVKIHYFFAKSEELDDILKIFGEEYTNFFDIFFNTFDINRAKEKEVFEIQSFYDRPTDSFKQCLTSLFSNNLNLEYWFHMMFFQIKHYYILDFSSKKYYFEGYNHSSYGFIGSQAEKSSKRGFEKIKIKKITL
jgi:hypothetical protein